MNQDDDLIVKPTTRITPDSNVSLIDTSMGDERSYLDNYASYDSYIYGDADATVEDTIETMTVYDPDSERYEDIDLSSDDEVVNCYAYSRKTGEKVNKIGLNDVSRALSNSGQFIWLGLYDPSLETMVKVRDAFELHELAIEDAFADHQRAKVENYDNDMIFVVLRTAKLEDNVIRYGTTAIFMGKNYLITIRNGPSNSYAPVREHCHRRPEKRVFRPLALDRRGDTRTLHPSHRTAARVELHRQRDEGEQRRDRAGAALTAQSSGIAAHQEHGGAVVRACRRST